jgi:hypothetical protein
LPLVVVRQTFGLSILGRSPLLASGLPGQIAEVAAPLDSGQVAPGAAHSRWSMLSKSVLQSRTVLSLLAVANSFPSLLICHRPADDPVAAGVAERLNDDAAPREEDTWSAELGEVNPPVHAGG